MLKNQNDNLGTSAKAWRGLNLNLKVAPPFIIYARGVPRIYLSRDHFFIPASGNIKKWEGQQSLLPLYWTKTKYLYQFSTVLLKMYFFYDKFTLYNTYCKLSIMIKVIDVGTIPSKDYIWDEFSEQLQHQSIKKNYT